MDGILVNKNSGGWRVSGPTEGELIDAGLLQLLLQLWFFFKKHFIKYLNLNIITKP
jgi:hypothetical protein